MIQIANMERDHRCNGAMPCEVQKDISTLPLMLILAITSSISCHPVVFNKSSKYAPVLQSLNNSHSFTAKDISPTRARSLENNDNKFSKKISFKIKKLNIFLFNLDQFFVGHRRNITLHDDCGIIVDNRSSWIYYEPRTRKLFGVLTHEFNKNSKNSIAEFSFRANGPYGSSKVVNIALLLPDIVNQWNYRISVKLQVKLTRGEDLHHLKVVETAMKLISRFYDEHSSRLVVISYKFLNEKLRLTWSHGDLDYPSCSVRLVRKLSRKIFEQTDTPSERFKHFLKPNFELMEIKEHRKGLCSSAEISVIERNIIEEMVERRAGYHDEIKSRRFRRSISERNAPVVKSSLGIINVSYCSSFFFQVPSNLFLDQEDGDTRNLTLSLWNKNETPLGISSWLQLDSTLQVLYGYLKVSDNALADKNKMFHYEIKATDSSGLTANAPISIKIPEKPPMVFYEVHLTVSSFEHKTKPDVNEQIFLAFKIFSYFGDNFFSGVNILSFSRNHSGTQATEEITLGWSNCTLTGPECPEATVETLISKVVTADGKPNPNFVEKLKPQYDIYDLKAGKAGACLKSSPVTPTPSSSISQKPVYPLTPIIRNSIPKLFVSTTVYFSYQIPFDTFYDFVDGYTRSLTLDLRTSTNTSLTVSSWMQFNTNTQTMYGLLTSNQFSGSYTKVFSFLLIATNSRGFSSPIMISLQGQRQTASLGALFAIRGRDNSASSTYNIIILSSMLAKLRTYLRDTRNDTIEVTSFDRVLTGQQRIFSLVYSNTTITFGNCNGLKQLTPLLETTGSLIHQDLTLALIPEVVADRIDIVRYGSCSELQSQSILPSPTPGGLFPIITNRVPVINIKTGLYFSYQIPANAFYDARDGNARKLSLQLTFSNGNQLVHSSWIQFNAVSQAIYGLLPAKLQTIRPFQNFTLILQAKNSLGFSALQIITLNSEYTIFDIGVLISFKGREYNSAQMNDVQLQNFMITQLRDYFNIKSNVTLKIISFEHATEGSSQFTASWTDSRLTSTLCDLILLNSIEAKVFSSKGAIHSNLIAKMLPSIILIDATVTRYGQCISGITTTISPTPSNSQAPRYIAHLPVINATTGLLFSYQIPHNTFHDFVDGNTRYLQLTMVNSDGSAFSFSSPVHFNTSNQTLHGIYYSSVLSGSTNKNFKYLLRATNSRNFQTTVDLSILVTANQNTFGVIVTTSSNTFFSHSTSDLQIIENFVAVLSAYIKPSGITDFSIISLTRTTTPLQQVSIMWTFNKIDGANCNFTTLRQFVSLLQLDDGQVNPNFGNVMSPTFIPFESTISRINDCNVLPSSLAVMTTIVPSIVSSIFPLFDISLSPSQPLATVIHSTLSPINNAPRVTSKILPLFAYFCTPFSYTIPADLFYDAEQGGTRNLKLQLETFDRKIVDTASWLQYSATSQVLYGILKVEDFYKKPPGGYKYYLTAIDNQGQKASTDFSITIPEFPPNVNHEINMKLNRVFDNTVADVNEQLLINTKILDFFKDANTNAINIISYVKSTLENTAVMKWSNCSLAYSPCPVSNLNRMFDKIVTSAGTVAQSFKNSLSSHYTIYSFSAEKLSPCNITIDTSTFNIPSTSTKLSSKMTPSPTTMPSAPPYISNPLQQLNISWCVPFEFQIPDDAFHDPKYGTTRNLVLNMFQSDGTDLPAQYWLKFDTSTQTILAYPTVNDLTDYALTSFLLIARNNDGLTVQQNISVRMTKPKPNPNHQLKVTASAYVTKQMTAVDVRVLIYKKMKSYFQSNITELISFTSYSSTGVSPSQIRFTFSNCSIPEDRCDRTALSSILEKIFAAPGIINSDFIIAFGPDIVITDVKVENLGLCTQFTLTPFRTPSSSYTQASTSVVVVAPPKNQPPLVLQTIGTVKVQACSVFTYVIPVHTFYDVEDGLTRNLKLSLTTTSGLPQPNDTWLQFDHEAQTLKGFIIGSQNDSEYILTATDKNELSVSQIILFQISDSAISSTFTVTIKATNYFVPSTTTFQILEQFMNKITVYLSGQTVKIKSFSRTPSNLNIIWTICSTEYNCNTTAQEALNRKLLLPGNIVNPNFVIALGPNMIVTEVQVHNVTECSRIQTTWSKISSFSPTTSLKSSYILVTSSMISLNRPPMFVKTVPSLKINLCSPFSEKLPADLCYDSEDRFQSVAISITYSNGSQLSSNSLLQFDKKKNTVYGMVTGMDLGSSKQLKETFIVVCADTKGLTATQSLPINITDSSTGVSGHSVTFHSYLYPLSTLSNVDIQLVWIRKLQGYLKNPVANSQHFLYFKRVSSIQAEFSVRLCTLDPCNRTAVQTVRDKIFSTIPNLNTQFISAMIPEFSLVSTSFQAAAMDNCSHYSSITPSPSLPFSTGPSSTIIVNNPPRATREIPTINITLCGEFTYKVPENVFFDRDVGYTANLTVTLWHQNGTSVGTNSWIQYNPATFTIYGYLVQERLANNFQYQLIASDIHGGTASVPITLHVLTPYNTITHGFITEADIFGNFKDNVQIMSEIATKIKTYIGQPLDSGLAYISFVKYDFKQPKIVFTWTSCSLLKSCDQTSLKAITDKLLFHGTILNFEFISALAPKFLVTKVQPLSSVTCTATTQTTYRATTTTVHLPAPRLSTSEMHPSSETEKLRPVSTVTAHIVTRMTTATTFQKATFTLPKTTMFTKATPVRTTTATMKPVTTATKALIISISSSHPGLYTTSVIPTDQLTSSAHHTTACPSTTSETITPVPSSRFLQVSSSVVRQNTPPVALRMLKTTLPLCGSLKFKIPNDTFIDKEDGNTQNLGLAILNHDHTMPGCNFTLKLNQTAKQMYGEIILSQWSSSKMMLLQAQDSKGLAAATNITFQVPDMPHFSTFAVTFVVKVSNAMCMTDILSNISRVLNSYLPIINVSYMSVKRDFDHVNITWTDCTTYNMKCDPLKIADIERNVVQNKTIHPELTKQFPSWMSLDRVQVHKTELCSLEFERAIKMNITYCTKMKYDLETRILNAKLISVPEIKKINLTFHLKTTEGGSITWVTLDDVSNSVLVVPVYSKLKDTNATNLVLNAMYNSLIIKTIQLTLLHPRVKAFDSNYAISLKILSYESTSIGDYKLLDTIITKIANYTNTSPEAFVIKDYNRTNIYPETVHLTLTPCFALQDCNATEVGLMSTKLALGNGLPAYGIVQHMLPNFIVMGLAETITGPCLKPIAEKNDTSIHLTVSLCTKLYSPVNSNLVSLTLNESATFELLNRNGEAVGLHSWLQFDKKFRVFYGVPTQQNLIDQPTTGYVYILRFSDRNGLTDNIDVTVMITGSKIKPLYSISVVFSSEFSKGKTDAEILVDMKKKLEEYLGNASGRSIGFLSFKRTIDISGLSMLEWTNCSLLNRSCDLYTFQLLSQKLITSNRQPTSGLINSLDANYTINKIIENMSNSCRIVTNTTNTAPQAIAAVPQLNVSACAILNFAIPENTFIDKEDGNTSSLLLSLRTTDGSLLKKSSWIQLDLKTMTILGIPTYDIMINAPAFGYSYFLHAQDTRGGISSLPVQVVLRGNVTERTFVTVTMISRLTKSTNRLATQTAFLVKSTTCLNISENSINIAYYREEETSKNINVSIYSNCSRYYNSCDETISQDLFQKLVGSMSSQVSYKRCMTPEFSIIDITSSISKLCRNFTRNTPPVVNREIPALNLTYCRPSIYKIPNDTFTDAEDGLNIMSNVELLRGNGMPVKSTDFIQLNKTSMTLYALYPRTTASKVNTDYILHVKDSRGAVASTKAMINFAERRQNSTYNICLSLRRYSRIIEPDIHTIITLTEKIERFFSDQKREFVTSTNYTITGTYPKIIDFCFTNCTLLDGFCDSGIVTNMRNRVFIRDGVVTQGFMRTLAPEYVIVKATESLSETCLVAPTTSPRPSSTISSTYMSTSIITPTIVMPTPINRCLSSVNTIPTVINSVGTIVAYIGQPVVVSVQNDVVYDKEDGYLQNLKAELMDISGNAIRYSWINFDRATRKIYISVMEQDRGTFSAEQPFRLVATDSCGASVYDVFKVKIVGSVSCCSTIEVRSNINYSLFTTNITTLYKFYQKLLEIHNDTGSELRIYAISKETSRANTTNVLYTNSSFTNESCFDNHTKELSDVALHDNNTVKQTFLKQLTEFKVYDASKGNNTACNATALIIPPIIIIPPIGSQSALTYEDWLWYILPFIILAFMVICCCFLFYWCTACRETCCGPKKGDDLFTAAAAKPIQEETQMGAAANALEDAPSTETPIEDIYADIATTFKDSSVPSLHKNKQIAPWMQQAAASRGPDPPFETAAAAPLPAEEDPVTMAAAPLAQEQAPPDTTDDPVTAGVAAMPRTLTDEDPVTASIMPMSERRPSYLATTSTSVLSSDSGAAPKQLVDDPVTQGSAPMQQAGRPLPERYRIQEDMIVPLERQGIEAAPPLVDRLEPVSDDPMTQSTLNRFKAATQPAIEDSASGPITGPAMRLPSTPIGEPPPPYSPPKMPRRRVIFQQKPIFKISNQNQRRTDKPLLIPVRSPELQLLASRSMPRYYEEYDQQPIVQTHPRKVVHTVEHPTQVRAPVMRKKRPSFLARTFSMPKRRQRKPAAYVLEPEKETIVLERSPSLRKIFRPDPKPRREKAYAPSQSIYLSDHETDVSIVDEFPPKMLEYDSKDLEEEDEKSAASTLGEAVPIEVTGVVKAPEKVLMKWLREGSLKPTVNTDGPAIKKKSPKVRRIPTKVRDDEYKHGSPKRSRRLPQQIIETQIIRPVSPMKKRRVNRDLMSSPQIYIDDTIIGSDDIRSRERTPTRSLKRGYPYSKDIYEYVDTVVKPRRLENYRTSRRSNDKSGQSVRDRGQGREIIVDKMGSNKALHRRKSRKNINEILARMARRKELKRSREVYEENELFKL